MLAEWRIRRVGIDYHVEVEDHLLQRSPSLRPRRGRGAAHRPHRRDLPQGRAHRRPSARAAATASTPRCRSTCPPAIAATPTGPSSASAASGRDRAGDCGMLVRPDPGASARTPSRASAPASASCGWPRSVTAAAPGRGCRAGASRSARGPMARSNPSSTTISTGRRRSRAAGATRRSSTPTSAARATSIDHRRTPLLTHPTLDQLNHARPPRHGQGLRRASTHGRGREPRRHRRMARAAARARDQLPPRQDASPPDCATPSCAIRPRVEDVDYRTPRGLDRALFQKLAERRLDRRARQSDHLRPDRRRARVGSPARSAISACRDNRSVLYHRLPRAVRRSGARPRRRPLSPACCAASAASIC